MSNVSGLMIRSFQTGTNGSRFNRSAVMAAYFANVRSILEYGSVIWTGAAKTHTVRVDRVQHKFLMWLQSHTASGHCPSLSYPDLLNHFKIPTLSSRRIQHDLMFIRNIFRCRLTAGHALLHIVNSCLTYGDVPAAWKHSLVTPIPKGKVSADPTKTRPISILPAAMKVVERLVQHQLTQYLEQHHLLASVQHGYRKRHSTETALHVMTDRILRAMNSGEVSILVLLDLSKAFDFVPHDKLLEKLALCRVDQHWFDNYLSDHTQQVQVRGSDGGTTLSQKPNSIGVFQGGSLSCALYIKPGRFPCFI